MYWSRRLDSLVILPVETRWQQQRKTRLCLHYFSEVRNVSLNQIRRETVIDTLKKYQAKRSIDLGCGEGKLVSLLAKDPFFDKIGGMDVSYRSLEYAQQKLERLFLSAAQLAKVDLFQGS